LKEFQLDPVTDEIIHVDFHGLKAGEKVNVEVAVHLVGTPLGVKEGGLLQHALHKIEIECLPTEIPEKIDVDVTNLKIGDSIHVKDLNLPNMKILSNPETTIVSVIHKAGHEVKEAAGEAPTIEQAEPEVIQKGKKTEEEEK
jgi:large subunit ribosomal protein L25